MKPTRIHYFYAQNWPARILFWMFPMLCAVLMAIALGAPPNLHDFGADARSYLLLIGLAWLIGYFVAPLLGWFILGPIYHHRAELNGAPFQAGDMVELLVGRERGQVVRVAEVWDWRGDLRVDLAAVPGRSASAIFAFTQVMKASDAEPPVAPERQQPPSAPVAAR